MEILPSHWQMADNDASEIDRREIILPTARFSYYGGVPTRLQKQVARFWRGELEGQAELLCRSIRQFCGCFCDASIHSSAPGPVRKYADVS